MTDHERTMALLSTTDAQAWASEWCRIARKKEREGEEVIDEGWMLTWFANAIETGREAGRVGEDS